jgi:hypothetical protein
MSESTPSLVLQPEPSANADLLTELLRSGARRLRAQAVEAETEDGRWADGIHSNVRMDDRVCLLVIVGVTREEKELVAVEDGFRESEASWYELLSGLRSRGLEAGPRLAVGDGALGFWQALGKVYPNTVHQRCWVHKTANVMEAAEDGSAEGQGGPAGDLEIGDPQGSRGRPGPGGGALRGEASQGHGLPDQGPGGTPGVL